MGIDEEEEEKGHLCHGLSWDLAIGRVGNRPCAESGVGHLVGLVHRPGSGSVLGMGSGLRPS